MAYLASYEYDVFVSYAWIDNEPEQNLSQGWISTFILNLETLLARKLGRRGARFFFDTKTLPANGTITSGLKEALHRSAVLLVFLSPGYMDSAWCRQERQVFTSIGADGRFDARRILLVHMDDLERPPEFADILGFRFWTKDPKTTHIRRLASPAPVPERDQEYYATVDDVAYTLANQLKTMAEPPRPNGASDAVYLAEVTDDLDGDRDSVRRFLEQAGITVLPDALYPRAADAFRKAAEADIARSRLFVQLLSKVQGKRSVELPRGYSGLQYEAAAQATILQWRSPQVDLASIADPVHRDLLGGSQVLAVDLEEFKRIVLENYHAPPAVPPDSDPNRTRLVFVNAHREDQALAEHIAQIYGGNGCAVVLPISGGSPAEVRKDFESVVSSCDAVLIVYETCTKYWVREQVLQLFRLMQLRQPPTPRLAIYQGPPPPDKDQIEIHWPGIRYMQAESDLHLLLDGLE